MFDPLTRPPNKSKHGQVWMRDQEWRAFPYWDVNLGQISGTQNGIELLNGVTAGFSEKNYQGSVVVPKKLFLCGYFTGATGNPECRVSVVLDRQYNANAVTPTLAMIFAATTTLSPLNDDNADRFILLWDHREVVQNGFVPDKFWEAEIDVEAPAVYTTGSSGLPYTNALLLTYIFDGGANQNLTFHSRLRFAVA